MRQLIKHTVLFMTDEGGLNDMHRGEKRKATAISSEKTAKWEHGTRRQKYQHMRKHNVGER